MSSFLQSRQWALSPIMPRRHTGFLFCLRLQFVSLAASAGAFSAGASVAYSAGGAGASSTAGADEPSVELHADARHELSQLEDDPQARAGL